MKARSIIFILLLAFGVGFASVSSQSLWIDEANSALKSLQPSFSSFLQVSVEDKGSDLQMPLYMVALWVWAKLVGTTEFALRALNIPFFVAAIAAICLLLRRPVQERAFSALAAMVSAFLWAYLDEARPYIMQFSGAMLCSVAVWNAAFAERCRTSDLGMFSAGALILCASSLLGVVHAFFLGLLLLAVWVSTGTLHEILRRRGTWLVVSAIALPMAALGLYYAWTLSLGAKASGVGQTNAATVAFALYEMLGFAGFGPGRIALRESGPDALRPHLATLALGVLPYGILLSWAVLNRPRALTKTWVEPVIIGVFVSAAFLATVAVGVFGDFRVVGRHLMPVFPFLLLAIGAAWAHMWQTRPGQIGVVASAAILLASAVSQRFEPRFAKDDYRSAAGEARVVLDSGRVVWWAADRAAAQYYRILSFDRVGSADGSRSVVIASNPGTTDYSQLPAPALIVLSKTDIYDSSGTLQAWLQASEFAVIKSFPAFTIYGR